MPLLAFETSCDETSAAVVQAGRVLSSAVSSQIRLHAEYGGVVPELAAREHLRNLIPIAQTVLREAGVAAAQLDAIAATRGPGLPSALMVGFKAAQAMAFVLHKPFVGIHHHEAHLYSPWISGDPPQSDFASFQPNVALIVSGGHTMLVRVESESRHRLLGATLDDAAGECFDKVGKMIGLPYPAGPVIDRLAEQGNPAAFTFPRPMIHEPNDDFSFSGLKTSVRYFLRDHPELLTSSLSHPTGLRRAEAASSAQAGVGRGEGANSLSHPMGEGQGEGAISLSHPMGEGQGEGASSLSHPMGEGRGEGPQALYNLCASVQAAIVDVLVTKTIKAARRLGVSCVTASGGVTCNRTLRRQLTAACQQAGLTLRLAQPNLCTDNAAMIGILAERKLRSPRESDSLSDEVLPNWGLDEVCRRPANVGP